MMNGENQHLYKKKMMQKLHLFTLNLYSKLFKNEKKNLFKIAKIKIA